MEREQAKKHLLAPRIVPVLEGFVYRRSVEGQRVPHVAEGDDFPEFTRKERARL